MGKVQLAYFLSGLYLYLIIISIIYFIFLVLYLLGPCPLGLISDIGASCPVIIQIQIQRGSVLRAIVVEKSIAPNTKCCCYHYAAAEA